MRKHLLFILIFLCIKAGFAQSVTIDPKANNTPVFEIKSTTEGMVMPKLTVAQRNVMSGLTAGTQVYCTDCTPYGPYNYDGGSWVAMFQTQTVSPITYTVGQAAQGGIVFWIDPASGGQHGLVAAVNDTFFSSSWGNDAKFNNAISLGFYGGEKNTDKLLNNREQDGAAEVANKYVDNNGNYGDWYLPSYYELLEMYTKRFIIGNFRYSTNINSYWSSTEIGPIYAYAINFTVGPNLESSENVINKNIDCRLRPVRRF